MHRNGPDDPALDLGFLGELPNLTALTLNLVGALSLEPLRGLTQLKTLKLHVLHVSDACDVVPPEAPQALVWGKVPNVIHIGGRKERRPRGNKTKQPLSVIAANTQVRVLEISSMTVDSADLLSNFTALRELRLASRELLDAIADLSAAKLRDCSRLKSTAPQRHGMGTDKVFRKLVPYTRPPK